MRPHISQFVGCSVGGWVGWSVCYDILKWKLRVHAPSGAKVILQAENPFFSSGNTKKSSKTKLTRRQNNKMPPPPKKKIITERKVNKISVFFISNEKTKELKWWLT